MVDTISQLVYAMPRLHDAVSASTASAVWDRGTSFGSMPLIPCLPIPAAPPSDRPIRSWIDEEWLFDIRSHTGDSTTLDDLPRAF